MVKWTSNSRTNVSVSQQGHHGAPRGTVFLEDYTLEALGLVETKQKSTVAFEEPGGNVEGFDGLDMVF